MSTIQDVEHEHWLEAISGALNTNSGVYYNVPCSSVANDRAKGVQTGIAVRQRYDISHSSTYGASCFLLLREGRHLLTMSFSMA